MRNHMTITENILSLKQVNWHPASMLEEDLTQYRLNDDIEFGCLEQVGQVEEPRFVFVNALIWTQGFSNGMNPFSVQKNLSSDWLGSGCNLATI